MLNYRKHNLWRAFVDFLFDNDEKVASSLKHTHINPRVQKPYPIYDQNGQNQLQSLPLFMAKTAQKTIIFGAAPTYRAHIRGSPPPPPPAAGRQGGGGEKTHSIFFVVFKSLYFE